MALVHMLSAAHDFRIWVDRSRQNIKPHADVRGALCYDSTHEFCLVDRWYQVCAGLGRHKSRVSSVSQLPELNGQNITAGLLQSWMHASHSTLTSWMDAPGYFLVNHVLFRIISSSIGTSWMVRINSFIRH